MKVRQLWIPIALAAAVAGAALPVYAQAAGDQGAGGGRREQREHNPQWQACKRQADTQKLEHGPARRSFMQHCMQLSVKDSSKVAAPAKPAG
jgi:hypothetical protein